MKINPSLNPHLICVLCGGYLIDATTIVECLHSFCKTCIVRYLETSKFCPICDVQVHKTKPFTNIRLDHTLQDLVYKLVPGLFHNEMKRRRNFYKELGKDVDKLWDDPNRLEYYLDDDGEIQRERVIFAEDEQISLALQLSADGKPPSLPVKSTDKKGKPVDEAGDCRYLLCPAVVTIGLLKKFIRMKFSLSDRFQIDIYHTSEALGDCLTLIDVAYIYMWRRKGPLCLYYTVYKNPAKKTKHEITCTETLGEEEKATEEETLGSTEKKKNITNGEVKPETDVKPAETVSEKGTEAFGSTQEKDCKTVVQSPSVDTTEEVCTTVSTTDEEVCTTVSTTDTKEKSADLLVSPKPTNDNSAATDNVHIDNVEKREEAKTERSEKVNVSVEKDKNKSGEKPPSEKEGNSNIGRKCDASDTGSNKTKIIALEPGKTRCMDVFTPVLPQNSVSSFSATCVPVKSPSKKEKHRQDKPQSSHTVSKPTAAILVVPTTENSTSNGNRGIPKLKLNTSKYTSQGIVTKSATLTTPIYHPRSIQKRPASPKDPQGSEKPSKEKMAKMNVTQETNAKSTVEKKPDSAKSSPSKKTSTDKNTADQTTKPSSSSSSAKPKLSQNGSAIKTPSNGNPKNAKNDHNGKPPQNHKTTNHVPAIAAAAAPPNAAKKSSKPSSSNGQKLKLTVPYSSYTCYTNGLTIPSPIGLSPTVSSPRPFPPSSLNRTLSSSPTRRKTSSPSRRVPTTTSNGRLTPGSSVSPSSLYSLSPSPTNRSFPTSPSPHSTFNPAARMLQTSPLARQMSSSTGRIFSFPDRGPPITHLPITVPTAHSHLNLRLNVSPMYSSNASPQNGDLPQDLSIKKKTSSSDESETPPPPPSTTLKIPIKVPIKTNGLQNGEIDKFAFTDDEEIASSPPVGSRKLHPIKAEPTTGT